MRMVQYAKIFKYLVPSWWPCVGRFKSCGLAGRSVSLRTGLESLKIRGTPSFSGFSF